MHALNCWVNSLTPRFLNFDAGSLIEIRGHYFGCVGWPEISSDQLVYNLTTSIGIIDAYHHGHFFMWVQGIWTWVQILWNQVHILVRKTIYQLRHLCSLETYLIWHKSCIWHKVMAFSSLERIPSVGIVCLLPIRSLVLSSLLDSLTPYHSKYRSTQRVNS